MHDHRVGKTNPVFVASHRPTLPLGENKGWKALEIRHCVSVLAHLLASYAD